MTQSNRQEAQNVEDNLDKAEATFRLQQAAKLLIAAVLELAQDSQPNHEQVMTYKTDI